MHIYPDTRRHILVLNHKIVRGGGLPVLDSPEVIYEYHRPDPLHDTVDSEVFIHNLLVVQEELVDAYRSSLWDRVERLSILSDMFISAAEEMKIEIPYDCYVASSLFILPSHECTAIEFHQSFFFDTCVIVMMLVISIASLLFSPREGAPESPSNKMPVEVSRLIKG